MRPRLEEIPEPDEPDEPDEPETTETVTATAAPIPAVDAAIEREYEYRLEVVTVAEVLDGKTLPGRLEEASHDEWHLVEIIDCGDRKAILLRKRKEKRPDRRPLGFFPHTR